MTKTQIFIKKHFLDLSLSEINKIVMLEFWYYYMKQNFGGNSKLYYMDTDSFIAYIKPEDIYADFAKDIKIKFDTLSYVLKGLLSEQKSKMLSD